VLLHHASAGDASIFNNAPVAVLLAVLLPDGPPQKHGGSLSGTPHSRNAQGLHYSRFRPIFGTAPSSYQWFSARKNLKIAKTMGESAKIG
jgi:hypothetical protein